MGHSCPERPPTASHRQIHRCHRGSCSVGRSRGHRPQGRDIQLVRALPRGRGRLGEVCGMSHHKSSRKKSFFYSREVKFAGQIVGGILCENKDIGSNLGNSILNVFYLFSFFLTANYPTFQQMRPLSRLRSSTRKRNRIRKPNLPSSST